MLGSLGDNGSILLRCLHRVFRPGYDLSICFPLAATLWLISFVSCDSTGTAGRDMSFKQVSTIAGLKREIGEPFGIAVRDGIIYVSDGQNGKIWRMDETGHLSVFADGLDTPSGIAFTADGRLLVADPGTNSIRSVSPSGVLSTIAGRDGHRGNTDGAVNDALFNGPIGVAAAADGRIFVTDTYNDRIRLVHNGAVTAIECVFVDGPQSFDTPTGIAVWGERLLIADTGNRIIRVLEPDRRVWTLAGSGAAEAMDGLPHFASFYQPTAVAVAPDGTIFIADGNAIRQIGGALPFVRTISDRRRGLADGVPHRARFNRPSGIAVSARGDVYVADSENLLVRRISADTNGHEITHDEAIQLRDKPDEFRTSQPPRWPFDPPDAPRDVAGTLGEIRGRINDKGDPVWFHNGFDIAGAYGETARFVRDEKVLRPVAAENFGTGRELIRMPTLGYIHIRLGRDAASKPFDDPRFQFRSAPNGTLTDVRVPRGTWFRAGEPIGTLNAMNHVHLIAGRSGSEMNAMGALAFPGLADTRSPTIESVKFFDEHWRELETRSSAERIILAGRTRVVVRAFDQADGNSERRRLGLYALGYSVRHGDQVVIESGAGGIRFDRLPPAEAVTFVYGPGSISGATGGTVFNYIVTNFVEGDVYREGFIDPALLPAGAFDLTVTADDHFGNRTTRTISFEVNK
jgi:sugar lactone lactonase YvrE